MLLCFPLCIYAENVKEKKPVIDVNRSVSITVTLNDDTRFMGLSLYPIAEYTNNRFEYLPKYNQLDIPKYYKLSREADKKAAALAIVNYIKENNIQPDYSLELINGKASISDLCVGVYLIIQNDSDENATLRDFLLIEAPKLSDKEYQYDFELQPKYSKQIWFSFRPEVVYPIAVVIGMIIGLTMCIFGGKVLRTSFMLSCFIIMGLVGMDLGKSINSSFLALLIFFVLFAFIGLAFVMLIDSVLIEPFRKTKASYRTQRAGNYFAAVLGAVVFAVLLYFYFIPQIMITSIIFAVLAISGLVIQYLRRDKYIIFHTYEDLIAQEIAAAESLTTKEHVAEAEDILDIEEIEIQEDKEDLIDMEEIEKQEDKVDLIDMEEIEKQEDKVDLIDIEETEEKKYTATTKEITVPKVNLKVVAYLAAAAIGIGLIIKALKKGDKA